MRSFDFNGTRKDFITIAKGWSLPAWAPINRTLINVPGMPGAMLSNTETDPRRFNVPIILLAKDFMEKEAFIEELASWLITDQPVELRFDKYPNRTFYAAIEGTLDFDEFWRIGEDVISFVCLDPYKYGSQKTLPIENGVINVLNQGTAKTPPIFKMDVLQATPFIDIVTDDGYMRLGQIPNAGDVVYTPVSALYENYGTSMIGWARTTFDTGFGTISADGEIISTASSFLPQSYGTGGQTNWFGPAYARGLSEQLQDFDIRFSAHQIATASDQVGRAGLFLLDVNNKPIARLAIVKATSGNVSTAECVIYDNDGKPFLDILKITSDSVPNWKDFAGHVVLRRDGQTFSVYAARTRGPLGREEEKRLGSFVDGQDVFQRKVASIAIFFQKFGTKPALNRNRILYVRAMKLNKQTGIPNIVKAGDVVEIDHKTNDIRINGETKLVKTFGSSFFALKPGKNVITIDPATSVLATVGLRERYL